MGVSFAPEVAQLVKEACCGCGACAASCRPKAIAMESDAVGFPFPLWDADKCVSCGACDRVCPALRSSKADDVAATLWAQSLDPGQLARSSSGGVFGLLARRVLERGGAVYGAAFAKGFHEVRHVRVDDLAGLGALLSSKYVQSYVGREVYESVRDDVRSGRPVLWSGAGCQVSGLVGYLGPLSSSCNLLTVEVICHGVPSPALWNRWVEYRERRAGDALTGVNFRSKSSGWTTYSCLYKYRQEKVDSVPHGHDWYMKAFLKNASLRGSCLGCPVRGHCGSDLTIGDYWGFRGSPLVEDPERGISAVIARTSRGLAAFNEVRPQVLCGETDYEDVLACNPALETSVSPHGRREAFLADVASGSSIDELEGRWSFERTLAERALGKLRRIVARKKGGS